MELAIKILNRIKISKPQKKFLLTLFTTILVTRGKINFRNMSRYSQLCEHTYSRNFAKPFDFIGFNRAVIDETFGQDGDRILAFDPSFIKKAGKHTFSRDSFWNGCASKAQKGLEISALSVVDIDQHKALTLSVAQTLSQEEVKRKGINAHGYDQDEKATRMQQYLDHIGKVAPHLTENEHYIVVDGSFANASFIFPDAKQFTGLCDAQIRDQARLNFHFNASLTTLNLAKSECFNAKKKDKTRIWSMGSVKILAFNQHYLNRIIRIFGLDETCIKKQPEYQALTQYGSLAA